jgi:hypothetical protein
MQDWHVKLHVPHAPDMCRQVAQGAHIGGAHGSARDLLIVLVTLQEARDDVRRKAKIGVGLLVALLLLLL